MGWRGGSQSAACFGLQNLDEAIRILPSVSFSVSRFPSGGYECLIQRLASLMPSRSSHVVHHSFLLTFSFSFLRHSAFRGFRGRDRRRGGTLIRRSLWVRYQPCASVERYKVSTYPHRTKESGPLEKKKASKVWTLKEKTHPTLTETRLRSSDFYPHCLPTWSHHHLKIVC